MKAGTVKTEFDLRKPKRKCVCVVGLRGLPGVMGGVETHSEELYPRVKKIFGNNLDIVIIARRRYAQARRFKDIEVLPIYAPSNKYLESVVHTALAILHARFNHKADIVHIHAIGPALMAPLARLLGMKVVVTHHGEDYRRAKWNGVARATLKFGEASAVRFSNKLIVITHNIRERLMADYGIGQDKIHYIPNGVAFSKDSSPGQDVLETFGLTAKTYILAVGRLVPEKGFQDLISAWRLNGQRNLQKKLVIVGDADHHDRFANELLAQESDDIIFTRRQPRDAVLKLFRGSSVFVLPSYHEGLPFAALEAIACGAPLVVSDIPGNREIGLAAAAYFPAGSVEQLAARLRADPVAFKADEAILDRYDWDQIATGTAALYRDLLDSDDARSRV